MSNENSTPFSLEDETEGTTEENGEEIITLQEDDTLNALQEIPPLHQKLREELEKPRVDVNRLKELCLEYKEIPKELRGEIWKYLLGVDKLPVETFTDLTLDPPLQEAISKEARNICEGFKAQLPETAYAEIERVLMAFFKKRQQVPVKPGIANLVAPFFIVGGLTTSTVYHCLSSVVHKFLPSLFSVDARVWPATEKLLHLLLLYHDPALTYRLAQRKVEPERYLAAWYSQLCTSLAAPTPEGVDALLVLWDLLFLKNDPFALHFFTVALVCAHREDLLKATTSDEGVDVQAVLNQQLILSHRSTVEQLYVRGLALDSDTPRSFRSQLFAASFRTQEFEQWVWGHLQAGVCLQVAMHEVIAPPSTNAVFRFFVIDCRSADQYRCGRMQSAFHLPPELLLEKPQLFEKVAAKFLAMKGTHFCFLGSGRNDPADVSHVTTIVLQFLAKGCMRVSVARGGYREAHRLGAVLVEHDPAKCLECVAPLPDPPASPPPSPSAAAAAATPSARPAGSQQTAASTGGQRADRGALRLLTWVPAVTQVVGTAVKETSAVLKQKSSALVKDTWSKSTALLASRTAQPASSSTQTARPATSGSVFTIDDEEDGLPPLDAVIQDIAEFRRAHPTELFFDYMAVPPATESGVLMVTQTHFLAILAKQSGSPEHYVRHKHTLSEILKITYQKKNPKLLTFVVESGSATIPPFSLQFIVENPKQCVAAITDRIRQAEGIEATPATQQTAAPTPTQTS